MRSCILRSRLCRQRLVTGAPKAFTSLETSDVADRCAVNIVTSPYPPVDPGPYPPLYEFVTEQWKPRGGYLDDKTAIIDGSTGLTRSFCDYHDTATALAAALVDLDVHEHSCIALFAPNHVDYAPIVLGVALTGARVTPINPLYTAHELGTILERSRSSVLIVHESVLETALQAIPRRHGLQLIVVRDDEGTSTVEGASTLTSLVNQYRDHALVATHDTVHCNADTHPVLLPYSSGTTGLPKAVCLSHRNIIANLLQCHEVEGLFFPADRTLISPLPFFHIYAFTVSLLYAAWRGHTLITTSRKFDLEQFCALIEEHRPSRAHVVPPILLQLAKHPVVDQYDFSSLQMAVSAAAPLSDDLEASVGSRIGCTVKQAWGMSELSPIGTMTPDGARTSGSVGPLVASTRAKIMDPETGASLGPNESGELLIQGPQVMMGYWNEPDKTAECLSPSGWLRTGDWAHYDEEGFFFITDRIKELIKVKGFQVAPAELEELLIAHESVSDAAVVQVPDEDKGEVPRAYVVLAETRNKSDTMTKKKLYEWVRERVVHYKRLDGGIRFVDSIPKSASGKILRRLLRDQAHAEMST